MKRFFQRVLMIVIVVVVGVGVFSGRGRGQNYISVDETTRETSEKGLENDAAVNAALFEHNREATSDCYTENCSGRGDGCESGEGL